MLLVENLNLQPAKIKRETKREPNTALQHPIAAMV